MISTKYPAQFRKCLEIISPIIQEANIRFKDDGIYIKTIDKTQILLLDFFISKKAFDSGYSVEPTLVGLNIQELKNMISRGFDEDKLSLNLTEQGLDILLTGKLERKFNLPFIDLSEQAITLPEQKYEVDFNITAGILKEILKDVNLVATTLIFKIQDNKLIIEANGNKGSIKTTLSEIKVKSSKNFSVKFSLAFLNNITKAMDNDKELLIKLREDAPIYLEYNLSKECTIKFYLSSMLI